MINIFETDPAKKIFPRYIPARLPLAHEKEIFYFKIDYSSGYFLRRVFTKFPALMKDVTLPAWTPNTAYAQGLTITPSAAWLAANRGANLIIMQSAAPAVGGAIEPIWPRTFGQVINDNTAIWTTGSAYNIQCPRLNLEFIDNANYLNRQPEPVQADLIGTPAQENNFLIEAPQPADFDLYGLNWNTPTPPTMTAPLNYLYKYGDVIKIQITGQKARTPFDPSKILWTPNFIDLMLIGYYCPTGLMEN